MILHCCKLIKYESDVRVSKLARAIREFEPRIDEWRSRFLRHTQAMVHLHGNSNDNCLVSSQQSFQHLKEEWKVQNFQKKKKKKKSFRTPWFVAIKSSSTTVILMMLLWFFDNFVCVQTSKNSLRTFGSLFSVSYTCRQSEHISISDVTSSQMKVTSAAWIG